MIKIERSLPHKFCSKSNAISIGTTYSSFAPLPATSFRAVVALTRIRTKILDPRSQPPSPPLRSGRSAGKSIVASLLYTLPCFAPQEMLRKTVSAFYHLHFVAMVCLHLGSCSAMAACCASLRTLREKREERRRRGEAIGGGRWAA